VLEIFDVFTGMKFQVQVPWLVTTRNVGTVHQRFGVPCFLHLQGEVNGSGTLGKWHRYTSPPQCLSLHLEDGEGKVLREVGVLQHYVASQPRRPWLWQSQVTSL